MRNPTKHIILVSVFCFIWLGLMGCEKINFLKPKNVTKDKPQTAVIKGTVVAKVNNLPITLEELNKYIDVHNASVDLRQDMSVEQKKEAKIDSRDEKIDYLKRILVRQAVFYQAAVDQGLDKKEEINDMLESYKIAVLAQEMQSEIVKNLEVSSAEIEEAYNSNKNLFKEPQSRKVREIVTKTEEDAKQILIELLQGADFATMARSRSISESAQKGGDLGFIKIEQRGERFSDFDNMVFSPALQQGAISSVFKGPDGYYIVKIEEIKEGRQIPISEAWDVLKEMLVIRKQQQELEKKYAELCSKNKIEYYEAEIK